MSYHAKKSTGQKSFGFIFVVLFHIVLIWGFASGLAHRISDKIPEILKAEVVKEEQVIEKEPPPPPPDIKPPPPDFVPPPNLDFVPDAPVNNTAIVAVQKELPKAAPVPSALTKAKPAGKGLSRPEYPSASIRLGEEGVTGLNLYIGEDGKVVEAKVASTSGSERLDEAAVKHAQRSWKFVPCMQGDKPVPCWLPLNFRWKIEDAKN